MRFRVGVPTDPDDVRAASLDTAANRRYRAATFFEEWFSTNTVEIEERVRYVPKLWFIGYYVSFGILKKGAAEALWSKSLLPTSGIKGKKNRAGEMCLPIELPMEVVERQSSGHKRAYSEVEKNVGDSDEEEFKSEAQTKLRVSPPGGELMDSLDVDKEVFNNGAAVLPEASPEKPILSAEALRALEPQSWCSSTTAGGSEPTERGRGGTTASESGPMLNSVTAGRSKARSSAKQVEGPRVQQQGEPVQTAPSDHLEIRRRPYRSEGSESEGATGNPYEHHQGARRGNGRKPSVGCGWLQGAEFGIYVDMRQA